MFTRSIKVSRFYDILLQVDDILKIIETSLTGHHQFYCGFKLSVYNMSSVHFAVVIDPVTRWNSRTHSHVSWPFCTACNHVFNYKHFYWVEISQEKNPMDRTWPSTKINFHSKICVIRHIDPQTSGLGDWVTTPNITMSKGPISPIIIPGAPKCSSHHFIYHQKCICFE